MTVSYKDAGVDVVAGYESVELMKEHVKRTKIPGVMSDLGGFGGMFSMSAVKDMKDPILVSGTDGVGTKLKVAFLMEKYDTVGIDCVAMCVNDVVCCGAKPLFFLDYMALGKNYPKKVADIVKGIADGCVMSNCALVGGETAEMPGFYPVDEFDLAGFCVGVVDKDKILDGKNLEEGDVLIGIASSGVHSNGFSLVRKVFDIDETAVNKVYDKVGTTLGEALLTPTKVYVKPALELIEKVNVKAISHITGGGFVENVPRMLVDGKKAVIYKDKVKVLPIFELIKERGKISEKDMFGTFNMGVGMVVAVDSSDVDKALKLLSDMGEDAYVIGEIKNGEKGVELC